MKDIQKLSKYMNLLAAMERALEGANMPIIITTATLTKDGPKIVYVNRAFCRSTGYKRDELLGQTPRILQGPKTDRRLMRELTERLKEGQPFFGETVNYRKDGTPYLTRWNISAICDDNGKTTHYVSFQTHERLPAAQVNK